MSGGIDTGYGDHFGDINEMVGYHSDIQDLEGEVLSEGLKPATDDAADQPDEERSVRG